jgi:UDP-N-acetylmuramyl pentapeptide phosphotransferase/UDP-N-acetylglucosamine-1-phosphate transferase
MTSALPVIAALALAFVVSAGSTLRLARSSLLLDRPNERSLHRAPVPRTGGLAILAGLAAAAFPALLLPPSEGPWAWVAGSALPVAVVSLLDDRGDIPPLLRLAAHLGAALVLLAGGVSWARLDFPGMDMALPGAAALLLTCLFVVWMINLYNFMDGMDGFAGGMALFGFASLAVIGWPTDPTYSLFNAVIAAAAGGFLLGNFPPARIFLGDLGSATLGLLAAASCLLGSGRGLFPLWVGWLVFSPFIVDATWTLLRRLSAGERVWEAHRSHHYQRLVLAGWSHRRTLLWSYVLMAACGATAVAAVGMSERDRALLIAGWAAIYLMIGLRVRLTEHAAGSGST